MPRTKVAKDKGEKTVTKKDKYKELITKAVEVLRDEFCASVDTQLAQMLKEIEVLDRTESMKIPQALHEKTQEEVEAMDLTEASNILGLSTISAVNSTKAALNSTKKPTLKRTSSFDEGYTTAETTSTSGGRMSRSRVKTKAMGPASRSLSRNNDTVTGKALKTPANRQPPRTGFDIVTPKVKPNTPQVLVRRPKLGEMALSFQGSPVLTGPMVCEDRPNVNIPLPDGNLLSLQSQRGLRLSQIPDFDDDTRRHLEILKDNLLKLCAK